MDCNSCNRNAHYSSRDGRNIVNGGMSSGSSNCGNMMQNRNSCGNMNQTRNNSCNRNQMRNNCGNMNQSRNSCGNMNQGRRNNCNMNQNRSECRSMEREDKCCNHKDNKKDCRHENDECRNNWKDGCNKKMEPVDEMMPAMSYVPWQQWEDIYCMEEGFERGTIFAQLDKEYIGRQGK